MIKQLLAAAAAIALSAPIAAQAQDLPSYATAASEAQVQGRISNFDGGYNLQVQDDNGYLDNVQLHDGTIINPTGLTLAPGMVVSILGYADGPVFEANEVDTPYTFVNDVPWFAGHPWDFYGPSIGFDFFFGGDRHWWHGGGNDWHGPVAYNRTTVTNVNVNRNFEEHNVAFHTSGSVEPITRAPRNDSAPAVTRTYSAPPATRTYAAPAAPRSYSAPAAPRSYSAPAAPARSFERSIPSGVHPIMRTAAPAPRSSGRQR